MTRINSNVDPLFLTDQHLMAEYREIPMVGGSLKRSLKAKTLANVLKTIPKEFCLNKGHVSFWYNKLGFLNDRFGRLKRELLIRGYNIDVGRLSGTGGFPEELYGNYEMSEADFKIIQERIAVRLAMKPTWYKYYGEKIIGYVDGFDPETDEEMWSILNEEAA
jgi:deoxyribonuclease (pyrimidine dimer)